MAAPMSSEGIVTVSYKKYRDTYRNTYQISQYISFVEKVYRYTPTIYVFYFYSMTKITIVKSYCNSLELLNVQLIWIS